MSRFWTQYEAWLSMQRTSQHGLECAPASERRCHISCIHNAAPEIGTALISMWAEKLPDEAFAILSKPDVLVTNQKDKEVQLKQIYEVDAIVQFMYSNPLSSRNREQA